MEDDDDYTVYVDEYDDDYEEDYDYRKARHLRENNVDNELPPRTVNKKRRQNGHASHKRVKPIGRCASGKE